MLEDPQSIQSVAEAIWQGLQVNTALRQDHPAGVFDRQVGAILFGPMAAATKDRVNETGANPAFYDAAWHVLYPGYVILSSISCFDGISLAGRGPLERVSIRMPRWCSPCTVL